MLNTLSIRKHKSEA